MHEIYTRYDGCSLKELPRMQIPQARCQTAKRGLLRETHTHVGETLMLLLLLCGEVGLHASPENVAPLGHHTTINCEGYFIWLSSHEHRRYSISMGSGLSSHQVVRSGSIRWHEGG